MAVAEPPVTHRDVTTIMELVVDIRDDVRALRLTFEEDDGEEEEDPEADA